MDWKKVQEIIEFQLSKPTHARGWVWHGNKPQAERFIMRDFIETLGAMGKLDFTNTQQRKPEHAPDFFADAQDGTRVAFEVSEFVSQEARRLTARTGKGYIPSWSDEQFHAAIDKIIRKKDKKVFKDGPYSKITLVIPTDEAMVAHEMVDRVFSAGRFAKARQITDGYLMMEAPLRLPEPGKVTNRSCVLFKIPFE